MIVRLESSDDRAAVRRLHVGAFPTAVEADLVERLRADGDAVISLVAVEDGDVVGHVMLSRMTAPFRALGLAPVAVAAGRRRRGVAARLIEEGVRQARAAGWEAIFVVGEPAYYARFGFSAAVAAPFESPYAGPYLMALPLDERGLPTMSGRVDYAPAFSAIA
jgi:putative acetyltransferase